MIKKQQATSPAQVEDRALGKKSKPKSPRKSASSKVDQPISENQIIQNKILNDFAINAKDRVEKDTEILSYMCYQVFSELSKTWQINLWIKHARMAFDMSLDLYKKDATSLTERWPKLTNLALFRSYKNYYSDSELIESVMLEFVKFPINSKIYGFIAYLNASFEKVLLTAWNCTIQAKSGRPANNYYSRSLPGTNVSAIQQGKEDITQSFINQGNLDQQVARLLNIQSDFQWNIFTNNSGFSGWSLFPFAYESGDKSYGRLNRKPSTSVSNIKSEVKYVFLNFTANKIPGLNFVEIDLKSCHTIIFRALYDFKAGEQELLPDASIHWNVTVAQFRSGFEKIVGSFSGPTLQTTKSWTDSQIKAICKNQWYKALNAGLSFNPLDNIKNSHNKLNLKLDEVNKAASIVEQVFKNMPVFSLLSKFKNNINACNQIYLPTKVAAFNTKTLSKQQVRLKEKGQIDDENMAGMTAMSRIFSSCQIVLIILVYISIAKIDKRVLPISYEADGLLLAGFFEEDELPSLEDSFNKNFAALAKNFMKKTIPLELKTIARAKEPISAEEVI